MATVERVNETSVGLAPLPSATLSGTMTGRETAGLERGLDAASGVAMGIYKQRQEQADTASVLEARRKLGDWERSWFDPANPNGVPNRKGRNAMGLVDEIDPDFARVQADLMSGLKSERAQTAFQQYAQTQRESILGRVNNYAVGENDKYVAEEFKASILSQTDRAATAALDGRWADQAREVQEGLKILTSMKNLNGDSDEVFNVRKQEFLSSVHTTAVNGMLGRGQINEASVYFDENADDMTAEAAGQMMARMRPQLLANNALAIADGIERGVMPAAGGTNLTVDSVWPAQMNQESGNRQTDKNGVPVTSPKGAIGVAQVMPATGPIAAQYAGLPWDPVKYKTDKAYNEAIGKAYMTAQVTAFGSVQLGLAAYNAGPGAVQKWIARFGDPRKGEISIEQFVEKIPYGETKEYVERIMARSGAAAARQAPSGGVPAAVAALPPNATLEQKIEAARSITDPQQRQEVEQVLRSRHGLRKQAEAETEAAVLEKVNTAVYAAPIGTPFAQIPGLSPEDVAFVTQKGHRDNYERIIQQRAEGTLPKTNPILFDTLRRQSVEDPEGFAKQKNFILANSHQFTASDYESLLGRVAAISDPKKAGERADWATEEQRVGNIARDLGIGADKKGADERAAVSRAYMEAERAFIQSNDGKKPTPEQRDVIALKVRQNLAEARTKGVDIVKRDASAAGFQGDVTLATRTKAAQRLMVINGGRTPTDAEVTEYISRTYLNRTTR